MNFEDYIDRTEFYLSEGEISPAIDALEFCLSKGSIYTNFYTLLKSRYNTLTNQQIAGIISQKEYSDEYSLISSNLLGLILKIKAEYRRFGNKSILKAIDRSTNSQKVLNKEKYFDNHIKPIYEIAEIVHKDYLTKFTTLLKMMRAEELVSEEIVDWLEIQRLERISERIRIKNFEHEIENTNYYKTENKTLIDEEIEVSTKKFLRSLLAYLNMSDNSGISWYSRFIEMVGSAARRQQINKINPRPIGISTIGIANNVYRELSHLVEELIPSAFNDLTINYSKLRGLCI